MWSAGGRNANTTDRQGGGGEKDETTDSGRRGRDRSVRLGGRRAAPLVRARDAAADFVVVVVDGNGRSVGCGPASDVVGWRCRRTRTTAATGSRRSTAVDHPYYRNSTRLLRRLLYAINGRHVKFS